MGWILLLLGLEIGHDVVRSDIKNLCVSPPTVGPPTMGLAGATQEKKREGPRGGEVICLQHATPLQQTSSTDG